MFAMNRDERVFGWNQSKTSAFLIHEFCALNLKYKYSIDWYQCMPILSYRDMRAKEDLKPLDLHLSFYGMHTAHKFTPEFITLNNANFSMNFIKHILCGHYFQTNSFQMVLATDEVYTYAIFNYINLVWSSHTEAGGKINCCCLTNSKYIEWNIGEL